VLAGLLALSLAARAGDEGRKVFAHYMVCIPTYGGDSAAADYQREMRAAQAAGIDGFALNCGGWTLKEPHYKKRALLLYEAAKQLGADFKLFISADYASGLTSEETRDMVETFRSHPNQFRYGGKPVLSTFGGKREQAEFVAKEFTGDRAICYVPFYYPTPAAEMPKQAQVDQVFRDYPALDGFFHFGAAGTPEQIVASNHLLAQKWLGAGKLFMAGVTPYYRGLDGNYRAYDSRGVEGLAKQFEGAIRDGATWIELVTWNDWGEASYLAPFGSARRTAFWNGHWGPMLSHAALLDACRYYIAWYKTGKAPAIDEDALYYAYRLHPKAATVADKRPGGADRLADELFVSLFLTAPARLTVHSGDTEKSVDVSAGVSHVALPFAPGRQRFVLTRNGDTVIDKAGEHDVAAADAWGNFNLFAGSAKPLTVRVRNLAGGPQLCVNGKPVPPRFFWGSENSARVAVGGAWAEKAFEFTPDVDVPGNGTLHFRFADEPVELELRDLRIVDQRTGAEAMPAGSFASPEAFKKAWGVWPTGADNTTGKAAVEGGALRIALAAPPKGGKWPDFHLHSVCGLSFAKGHTYRCTFRVRGKPDTYLTPCVYRHDGGYSRIGGPQGSFYSQIALARDAGVDLVSYAAPTCWAPPEQAQDWSPIDALCQRIIEVNPKVLLVPRVDANAPGWWLSRYPEARMVYDGKTPYPVACVSDRAYRADMCAHLEKLARHLCEAFPDNFAGVHPCGQNTGEWFYYDSWKPPLSGYDAATRDAFREWLKARGDPAWAAAEPPAAEERRAHPSGFLRDPAKEARLVEFARFQQREMSDFVGEMAAACRRGTGGKKLVLFFYGYGFEFPPLGNGAPTSGHYALGPLLKSRDIDILCSPISYTDREWLGTAPCMSAAESVKAAGILWLNEDDSRTYLDPRKQEHVQEGGLVDLKQTQQVMLRNTAQAALRGFGTWWMDLPGQGWFNDAAIWEQIVRLRPVDEAMAQRTMPFAPEIAAIIDEDSMCHLTGGSAVAVRPLIYEGRAALGRCGAPYGQYLLEDALAGRVPARLQFFLSAWQMTTEQRRALCEQRRDGRTAAREDARPTSASVLEGERPCEPPRSGLWRRLIGWCGLGRNSDVTRVWCWAPGYLYPDRTDAAGIEEVTGFKARAVTLSAAEVAPTEIGRKHGLTRAWGPKAKIEPLLSVEAAPDEVWATYSDGSAAVAVRRTRTGHDVFVGVPQLTPELAHALAKLAGAHCYTAPGPALWAANGHLSLQAQTNGVIRIDTGRKGPICDALDGLPLGSGPHVELNMDAGDVRVIKYRK
jgi:hypothetical protein